MTKETELLVVEKIQPLEFFKGNKAQSFLQSLEKAVDKFKQTSDISTAKGRAEIKSFAYSISQRKSPIEKAKLELTKIMRNEISTINDSEKAIQIRVKELQEEVRRPLTEFEEKEKKRIEDRRLRIARIEYFKELTSGHAELEITAAIKDVEELKVFDWQEFAMKAENVSREILDHLNSTLGKIKIHIAEKEQLEQLLKEKEEREKKDREKQIIKETEANILRVEREKAERVAKEAEQARYKLEAEKKAAEIRVKETAKIAKAEREQAKIQAERDKEEAIRLEKARVQAVRQKEIEEEKAREANLKHSHKIHSEAKDDLINQVMNLKGVGILSEEQATSVVVAIARDLIANISIKY